MEHQSRIKRIQEYLRAEDLSAFLVLTKLNRQYVSGFTGSSGAVLVTKRGAELFVDDRYTIRARHESSLKVRNLTRLSATLSDIGEGRVRYGIGIEDTISIKDFRRLKKDSPGIKFTTTSNFIENLRAVKSAAETKYIKKAQKIIDQIFFRIRKYVNVGMTEMQIAQKMEQLAIKFGAAGMAFESIVAFGANAATPHHLSGKQKIKKNNFLLLDFGVLISGYHSDFTRTLFIGSPSKKQVKVYNTVLTAQEKAIRETKPGIKASAIDSVARRLIGSFGKYFTHNTGHGVGLEIHELPNFSPKSEDILRQNMIVTVEPGIYIENWGGVRVEDMVLVSGNKPVVLSRSPKDLRSMTIK